MTSIIIPTPNFNKNAGVYTGVPKQQLQSIHIFYYSQLGESTDISNKAVKVDILHPTIHMVYILPSYRRQSTKPICFLVSTVTIKWWSLPHQQQRQIYWRTVHETDNNMTSVPANPPARKKTCTTTT